MAWVIVPNETTIETWDITQQSLFGDGTYGTGYYGRGTYGGGVGWVIVVTTSVDESL